jgi:hypothetical protein
LIGTYNLKIRAYLEFGQDLVEDKNLFITVNVKHQCTKATINYKNGYGSSVYFKTQYINQDPATTSIIDVFDIYDAGMPACILFTWDTTAVSIAEATFVAAQ